MAYSFTDELGTSRAPLLVTPTPSTNLTTPARALYIGTGGNLNILSPTGGTRVIFYNLQSGSILPVAAVQISNVDTTASNIVALI
jgi:hypothetical protein